MSIGSQPPVISFKNVTKSYGRKNRIEALSNVCLDIPRGAIFGVIGLSGAGKSTLIRCVNALERPESGTVEVAGQEINTLSGRNLIAARRRIGMIFQHFNLFASRTVRGNIAFPLEIAGAAKSEIDNRVDELLNLVGLHDKANAFPAQLSGGQKQRVGIARALANNPEVLLADEATSALDPETTVHVLHLLRDINRRIGVTILLITHEMAVIQEICDQVAIIEGGRLAEVGNTFDVFTKPQSDIGRRFVHSHANAQAPGYHLQQQGGGHHLPVRLTFTGTAAERPVIANLTRTLPVTPNIVSGHIQRVQGKPVGVMVIDIDGKPKDVDAALAYLEGVGVQIEVLTHDADVV